MNLNTNAILSIIQEPAHGERFYTQEQFQSLIQRVNEICSMLEITEQTPHTASIDIINNFIKQNVTLRGPYFDAFCERQDKFDPSELVYRTAYGALVKGEAMCAGFTEAVRIILAQYGIQSDTLLSKLPGRNKRLLHYVALAKYTDNQGNHFVLLDPERQKNCEKKGLNFKAYQESMLYMLPTSLFTNDLIGENGVGMGADEYIRRSTPKLCKGTANIGSLFNSTLERG